MILTFHGLGEPPAHVPTGERPFWVRADVFEATLDEVARRPNVAVTFDDGNRSDVDIALPALRARGLVAKFFIAAGRLDRPGYLGRDDLLALADAGMTVGSHGVNHEPWTALGPEALDEELTGSRSILEEALGRPVTEASCPFGKYNRRVLATLRRAGYERVYTSDGGRARPSAWLQPRNTLTSAWEPTAARLDGREPARRSLARRAKRTVKQLR
jgi:peptidoglycan/xylan/chitin deacetylase (PgdA/CDA1 family)